MLLLAAMIALAQAFGLDILLGAFAAGVLTRLVLHGAAPTTAPRSSAGWRRSASASWYPCSTS